MDTIELRWTWEFGSSGPDHATPDVLRRTFSALLAEGRPQGSVRFLFFQPTVPVGPTYWLGTLCLSQGERVIYFPGPEILRHQISRNGRLLNDDGFAVDHLSLDSDLRSWHLTAPGSRQHQGGPRTLPLSDGGVLWFGLLMRSPDVLPQVAAITRISFELPPSDSKRRKKILLDARAQSVDNILGMNSAAFDRESPWHVQCNFAVGPSGFEPDLNELGRPAPSQVHAEQHDGAPARLHRVALSPGLDVLVTSFPRAGTLDEPLALVGWG